MVRSILIFVYIAVVLLVSGLAQASVQPSVQPTELAQIDNVHFDDESYLMHVRGAFMNTCQSTPTPVVLATTVSEDTDSVVIGVKAESAPGMACAQVVKSQLDGQFDLVFDIRALKLAPRKNLVLKFKNLAQPVTPITARIEHEAHGLQIADVRTNGMFVELASVGFDRQPLYAVVTKDGEAVHVRSLIDLSDYVNRQVRLAGIRMGHAVAPRLDGVELDFSKKTGEQPEQLFATEISFAPLQ